ncbi:SDR family oxidoreductase [Arthrobacter sp. zg-Y820]|uniref:SDR family oxidoreductase n=1 Tax=unclassified Arthrobacter TaxID=235627 RepID=UPI001E62498F|nr:MULTISPECIES: SDR family oxidoreductase [unclassified Arthrobacter]MCC9197785.1 SDR family oxidoreductase [Arthrobacter sp. zg-Y820]MDK1280652.1 SDR family oxidoreductase [Arthrobacter sp. zg.Y820]WIB10715.1 SDR family oxidoreductase [Arthrobacter sp. zg-Y820]
MAEDQPEVAVTGATGALGGTVARLLAEAGIPQRLLARHTAKLPHLPGTPVYAASYSDREHAARALNGVRTLFMVSAHESLYRRRDHRTFVDAAVEAGVRHIVYTSFMGAAPDAVFTLARDHWDTEEYIKSKDLDYTFLRDCLYQDVLPSFVGRDGVLRGPAGTGRLAAVARADVARAAARILTEPDGHLGKVYTLTGPQALTFEEISAILTRVTGSQVTYYDETVNEALESRSLSGVAQWQIEAWVSTYTAVAAGRMAEVSPDVERLTGAPPQGLEDYLMQR